MDLICCYCSKETHKDPSEDAGGTVALPEDSCTQHTSAGLWRKPSGCKRTAQCTRNFSDPKLATRLPESSAQTCRAVNCVGAHKAGTESRKHSISLKQQFLLPPPLHSHAQLSDRYRNSYPSLTYFTGMCSKVIS